jgi:hypothetical protein
MSDLSLLSGVSGSRTSGPSGQLLTRSGHPPVTADSASDSSWVLNPSAVLILRRSLVSTTVTRWQLFLFRFPIHTVVESPDVQ